MNSSLFHLPRNVKLLAICQVIGLSAMSMVFLTGGLIGAEIAPTPNVATLPATMLFVGLAVATLPSVMLMNKIGRKKGFLMSAIISSLSMFLATYALTKSDFYLFNLAVFLLGTHGAFIQQYRFAALESVPKQNASKAVSLILFAGIIAGFAGPEIVKHTSAIYALPHYAGAFLSFGFIFCLAVIILAFFKDTSIHIEKDQGKARPISRIVLQRGYLLAVLAGAIGYGVMICIMTATPIFLHKMSHMSLDNTAIILQSHIVSMYLPSLITGNLITRFGPMKIITAGIISFLLTIILATTSISFITYLLALILLGVGWNFLYITATILLPHTYTHNERFKAQGVNDFAIVLTQMSGSFLAGSLLFNAGWINLNLLMIPLLLVTLVVFMTGRKYL